jgi:hypothetical protein
LKQSSLDIETKKIKQEIGLLSPTDELLGLFVKLEQLKHQFDIDSTEGSCVNLSYTHDPDVSLIIDYNWSTWEEGGQTLYQIDLKTLEMIISDDRSTVYGENKNSSYHQLNKVNDLLSFLTNEL